MKAVVWSRAARDDLDRIWMAVAVHDLRAAHWLVDAVEARIALLRALPNIGSPTDRGDRKLSLGGYPHILIYSATAESILVLGVRHMAQRPQ